MNDTFLLAQIDIPHIGTTVMAVVGIVVVIFVFAAIWASRYSKVGPNEVLIVSGRKHRFAEQDDA
jgi:flotillin